MQEWFAERAALANDAWAQQRAVIADHDGSLIGRATARLRGWLFDAARPSLPASPAMSSPTNSATFCGAGRGRAPARIPLSPALDRPSAPREDDGRGYTLDVFARYAPEQRSYPAAGRLHS